MELGDDAAADVRDQAAFQLVQYPFLHRLTHIAIPIMRGLTQMGDGCEGIKGGAAFGRKAGVGDGRVMQIEREVLWHDTIFEDVVQQPLIARAEQYHVVRDTWPCALYAQMQHEQRRRPAFTMKGVACPFASLVTGQQIFVRVHHIAI